MKTIQQSVFTGERALFGSQDLIVDHAVFENGESPLKECRNIRLENSIFKWKYPVWYSHDIRITKSTLTQTARAGIWYSNGIVVEDTLIEAPKTFRRCDGLTITDVSIPNAEETLWNCRNVTLNNVNVKGDYFAMHSENLQVDKLTLVGGYAFDGVRNVEIRNARIQTKDAFWNSENVTVYDSFISSEYLGWNSRNLTLINCTVESLQGMCYIENLVMKNCTLLNTNLAFEYSTVDVSIKGHIDSIKNPRGGFIQAESIGEVILEEDKVDITKTIVVYHQEHSHETCHEKCCCC